MIKDEYEILAYSDLTVANVYLDTMLGVLRSLKQENSPLYGDLEKAYLGLSEFTHKYKYRLEDISSISKKIEEARDKHRTVVASNSELVSANADLSKQLNRSRELCIELQYDNETLKNRVSELEESLKSFLPV